MGQRLWVVKMPCIENGEDNDLTAATRMSLDDCPLIYRHTHKYG